MRDVRRDVRSAMGVRRWVAAAAASMLVLAACGGDDDAADPEPAADDGGGAEEDGGAGDGGAGAGGGGGAGGGTLVLGAETITLDSARCFLEEQESAGGGGKILFVAQGFGTTADGEPLTLDVSRYDEDSQFTGDDVIVDIGDPFADSAVSLTASGDIGTVTLDGSSLSADGLTFVDDDFSEQTGSFELNC